MRIGIRVSVISVITCGCIMMHVGIRVSVISVITCGCIKMRIAIRVSVISVITCGCITMSIAIRVSAIRFVLSLSHSYEFPLDADADESGLFRVEGSRVRLLGYRV